MTCKIFSLPKIRRCRFCEMDHDQFLLLNRKLKTHCQMFMSCLWMTLRIFLTLCNLSCDYFFASYLCLFPGYNFHFSVFKADRVYRHIFFENLKLLDSNFVRFSVSLVNWMLNLSHLS